MTSVSIHFPASAPRSYDVVIGAGVLDELGPRAASFQPASTRRAFLAYDNALPAPLVERAARSLDRAGFAVTRASVRATEANKSLATFARLLESLGSTKHERRDPVIALGGGIVGDLAGFIASSYRRGVPFIQCPTTLLSMVDASVGGKTGVNLGAPAGPGAGDAETLKKNLVGCFWQPALVLADLSALDSLGERHFHAGLAECLKHGLIAHETDPGLFEWTLGALPRVRARDAATLAELVERNVRVKAWFVGDDEREEKPSAEGGRALLNLGHTFGHAIETLPGLSPTGDAADAPLHHGEAVALGLVAAGATSVALGRLLPADFGRIREAVRGAGLPDVVRGLPSSETILGLMAHDKKVAGGRLRLVLPVGAARCEVIEDPPTRAVIEGIEAIRAERGGR